jgi:hypothetical protein
LAGKILQTLVNLADCAPQHATLNKAQYLVIARLRKSALAPDGSPRIAVPLSRRSMKGAWAEFSTVCHFYAAFEQMLAEFAHDFNLGAVSRETMRKFLAVAEAFRHRGQEHRSRGSLRPTLDEEQMWTVPANTDSKKLRVGFYPHQISKSDLDELGRYSRD